MRFFSHLRGLEKIDNFENVEPWGKIGLKKHSYSKETHFHGLCLVKISDNKCDEDLTESFYILQDKHELE